MEWANAGADDFQPCDGGATHPDAVIGCGPYGVGEPGTYTIRVTWREVEVDQNTTLEKDGSYQSNTTVTFAAADFGFEGDTGR